MIPPPPQDTTSRHFRTWVERTFPIGSTFRYENTLCVVDDVDQLSLHLIYKIVPGLRNRFGDPIGGPGLDEVLGRVTTPLPFYDLRIRYLNGTIYPTADHWAPLQGAAPTMKYRRLAPNTIPSPPPPPSGYKTMASTSYGAWVERTYQPGTPVLFRNGIATLVGWLPPGARGVVERVVTRVDSGHRFTDSQMVFVRVTDARDASGLKLPQFVNHVMQIDSLYYMAAGENMTDAVAPLEDRWSAAVPAKRTSLPSSQRRVSMKHRRLAPNMVQPPNDPTTPDLFSWAKVTYAPGTPVKFEGGGVAWWVGDRLRTHDVLVPDGTRGTVVRVDAPTADNGRPEGVVVTVKVHDARAYAYAADAPTGETRSWIEADIMDMWKKLDAFGTGHVTRTIGQHALRILVPLDDNWASPKSYRQVTLHRVTTGIKRTSRPRRVSPNRRTSKKRTSRQKGKMRR